MGWWVVLRKMLGTKSFQKESLELAIWVCGTCRKKKQVTEDAWGQEDEVEREKAVRSNFFNNSV